MNLFERLLTFFAIYLFLFLHKPIMKVFEPNTFLYNRLMEKSSDSTYRYMDKTCVSIFQIHSFIQVHASILLHINWKKILSG